jgi:hypothetical protein
MAQTAICYDLVRPVRVNVGLCQAFLHLLGGFERVVIVQEVAEVEMDGARDMSLTFCPMIKPRRGADALSTILFGRTYVYEDASWLTELGTNVVAPYATGWIYDGWGVIDWGIRRDVEA